MNNEITTRPEVNSLAKAQTDFMSNVLSDLKKMNCVYTDYGKICGLQILAEINHLLVKEGKSLNDEDVDQLSIVSAVQFAMMSELNVANKEIFVQFRNVAVKTGKKYKDEKGYWKETVAYKKSIECKPQYKGQMKLITKFGVGIEKVYPIWVVREGDEFTYASFKGVEMTPPTWSPKSYTKPVIRVVVPVKYKDGDIQYHISELDSIATNIKAQIKQTLLGADKAEAIKVGALMKDMSFAELIASAELQKYINSTYTGISREEMYITKLVLNATKRITIDYGSAFVRELAETTYDNSDVYEDSHHAREVLSEQEVAGEITTQADPDKIALPDDDLPFDDEHSSLKADGSDNTDFQVEDLFR